MVFSSTCATYGIPNSESIPINELCIQNPINPYGRSKLMVEQMIKDFSKSLGLSSVIFRYFNAAGAHPNSDLGENHNPETHLIPLALEVASGTRETINVFGNDYPTKDGTCIRDYIHVCDLADAHVLGLNKVISEDGFYVYNLGNEQGYSVNEVIDTVNRVTNSKIKVNYVERREGDPHTLVASARNAKNELKWSPKYAELETIIQHAWKWHQQL